MMRRPRRSTLFPYPTLSRSVVSGPGPVLCVAWDMPFVSSGLLAALVDGAAAGDYDAFLPQSDGRRGVEPLCAVYGDRKSTRLNSSHSQISYAVFCLKKNINE